MLIIIVCFVAILRNIRYTVSERIWMVDAREKKETFRKICDNFAAEFLRKPISNPKTARKIVKITGNVDPRLTQINRALSEDKKNRRLCNSYK